MSEASGLALPIYSKHYAKPVKIVRSPDGSVVAWTVSRTDGSWKPANDLITEIIFAREGDTYILSPSRFVEYVEERRADWAVAEGEIAALYETVDALLQTARQERRDITKTEYQIVRGIRHRTYRMFEEKLVQEGNPAADPDLLTREGNSSP